MIHKSICKKINPIPKSKKSLTKEPRAFELLKDGLDSGDFKYLRLYFLYRYGKPREQKEISINSNQEQPLFNIVFKSTEEMENE